MKGREKHIKELENAADFLRKELEQARIDLEGEPLSIKYDHGGGQSGRKENPAYTAYTKLLKSYQAVINQLESLTGSKPENNVVKIQGASKWKRA